MATTPKAFLADKIQTLYRECWCKGEMLDLAAAHEQLPTREERIADTEGSAAYRWRSLLSIRIDHQGSVWPSYHADAKPATIADLGLEGVTFRSAEGDFQVRGDAIWAGDQKVASLEAVITSILRGEMESWEVVS